MRSLKFRAWDEEQKKMLYGVNIGTIKIWDENTPLLNHEFSYSEDCVFEQYTGLKDRNGKEIYENCELDGRYRVEYIAPKFVGKDIIKGDIIELYDNKFTITKEHCEISQNSERGIN